MIATPVAEEKKPNVETSIGMVSVHDSDDCIEAIINLTHNPFATVRGSPGQVSQK
jgi:hypothetical protein